MVYRRREWMVTMSHLWTMVSRNMFLRLNLIFNLVLDGNNVFFISLIWLFFILRFRNYDEMACFNIILHQHVQNYPRTLFYFFIHDGQIYPWFFHFSVGRNEHKFVIWLRVKVFTFNILIEYSMVHPECTLKYDYSTKIGTLFFLDFHSVRRFRPTFYLVIQIICSNFWFIRFFDLNKCFQ